jgi:hypothetical protein
MKQVRIEVLQYTDDAEGPVIKTLGPMSLSKADKVERGLNRNLDHANYWTRQVETLQNEATQ